MNFDEEMDQWEKGLNDLRYSDDTVLERTEKGISAMLSYDGSQLPESLWALLSHINGRIPVGKHRSQLMDVEAVRQYGSVDNCLNVLEEAGFIARLDSNALTSRPSQPLKPERNQQNKAKPSKPAVSSDQHQLVIQKYLAQFTEIVERDLSEESWEILLKLESMNTPSLLQAEIVRIANLHKKRFSTQSKRTIKLLVNELNSNRG